MQSVGAAWLMTSLSSSPLQIALIQTASALPFFLLALPAGSLGDIVDRRKLILGTEFWMLAIAGLLAVATFAHFISPWLLLLLTFALSIGDALESPAWRAIFPELVCKEDLAPALVLNGIEFNLARAVGPALGGVIIAIAGVSSAFLLNVLSFLGVIVVIAKWKRPVAKRSLPAETFTGASVAAFRYVRYSPGIRRLLVRSAFVIFFASSFWALLPAVVKNVSHSSLGYGLLLGFFGTGAVLGAVILDRLRKAYSVEAVVAAATGAFACVLAAAALLHNLWILSLFSFLGGVAWTIFMSVFNTLIQRLAPDWVRARVLAVYLFVFQGSMALGSVLWGVSAERATLEKLFSPPRWESPLASFCACPFRSENPAQLWMHGITGQNPRCSKNPSPTRDRYSLPLNIRSTRTRPRSSWMRFTTTSGFAAATARHAGGCTMTPSPQASISKPSWSIPGQNISGNTIDLPLRTGPLRIRSSVTHGAPYGSVISSLPEDQARVRVAKFTIAP